MKRRYILMAVALVFGISVLLFSMVRESHEKIQKTPLTMVATNSGELEEYVLPYPGMLPDNPLYFLKMVRDRFKVGMVDEAEKPTVLLYMADKRIGAAEALFVGNKLKLSIETAQKAEQYMGRMMEMLRDVDDVDMWMMAYGSIGKHKELLDEMSQRVEGEGGIEYEKIKEKYCIYEAEAMGRLGIEKSEDIKEDGEVDEEMLEEMEKGYL
jgi:hypothetical protein